MDRGRRIPHEHFGRIVGRATVDGRVLREIGQPGRLLPRFFVEDPVDGDGGLEARDGDCELPVAAAERGRGIGRKGDAEEERGHHSVIRPVRISPTPGPQIGVVFSERTR